MKQLGETLTKNKFLKPNEFDSNDISLIQNFAQNITMQVNQRLEFVKTVDSHSKITKVTETIAKALTAIFLAAA